MSDTKVSPSEASDALYHEEERPWWLPMLLLTFPLIPSFRQYHVTLTATTLEFGYVHDWVMARVDRAAVASVAVVRDISGLWQWGGYGVRARPATQGTAWFETGYIHRDGSGLRIAVRDAAGGRRFYTFNVDRPEELQRLLGMPEAETAGE